MNRFNCLDESDELDIALMCLEENIDDDLKSIESSEVEEEIEDNIGDELDSVYSDSFEMEPDDSDVSIDGMDAEEYISADFDMVADEDEEILDIVEKEAI